MLPELIYERPGVGKISVPLNKPLIEIGSLRENDILLDYDNEVSPKHARIIKEGDRFFIEEPGRANKTLLNGLPIDSKRELSHNDEITIGNVKFTFSNPAALSPGSETPDGTLLFSSADCNLVVSSLQAQLIYEREGKDAVRVLLQKDCNIGRAKENDLFLDDNEVSGKHARLLKEGDGFFIEDLGSTNKTYLNGVAIKAKTELKNNDEIKIGKGKLKFINPIQGSSSSLNPPSLPHTIPSAEERTVPLSQLQSSAPPPLPSTIPSSITPPPSRPPSSLTHSHTIFSASSPPPVPPNLPIKRRGKTWQKSILSIVVLLFIGSFIVICMFYYKSDKDNGEGADEIFDRAEKYYIDENYDDALKEYKKVREKDHTRLEAYRREGAIYESRFDYEKAIKIYKEANDMEDPSDTNVLRLLNQIVSKKLDRGKEASKRLAFLNYTGNAYFLDNDYQSSEKWYEGLRCAYEGSNDKEHFDIHQDIQKLYGDSLAGLGRIDMIHHRYEKAEKTYKKVLGKDIDPTNLNAKIGLGYVYMGKEDYDKSEEYFTDVLDSDVKGQEKSKKIEAKLGLAELYKVKKDYDKSIRLYKNIKKEYPELIEAYTGEAEVFMLKKEYSRGKDVLDDAQKEKEKHPRIYLTRGKIYFFEENYREAEEELKKAQDIHPNCLEAKIWQAKIYHKTHSSDVAIKKLTDEVLAKDPENFDALKERAGIYMSLNDYDSAIKDLKKAEEADPDDKEICILCGDASYKKKNYGDVVHYYDEKGPEVRTVIRNDAARCQILGHSYEETGEQGKANEWYNRAKELKSQNK